MEFLKKFLRFGASTTDSTQVNSKEVAKERLKLALTYDRSDLPRGTIEQLRDEIIQLIAKHLTIDAEEIQIQFDHTTDHGKLIASIPLRKAPRLRPVVLEEDEVVAVGSGKTDGKGADSRPLPAKAHRRRRR